LAENFRSYFKNVFWPNVFVGASFQILEILKYSSGLTLGPAATLNQNPIFEMASHFLSGPASTGVPGWHRRITDDGRVAQ
jgi:hypothetical protein